MSFTEKLEFLNHLKKYGVKFYISIPQGSSIWMSPEECIDHAEAPYQTILKYHGMSAKQYNEWVRNDYKLLCSGITANGTSCQNTVKGGHRLDSEDWVARKGEFCYLHIDQEQLLSDCLPDWLTTSE